MQQEPLTVVEYPRSVDAETIKAIQDSWVGARVGSTGFLLSPESLERIGEMIESRNILVARRGDDILAYLTFYRRSDWEVLHPDYTSNLTFMTDKLRSEYGDRDYVVIDHIAKNKLFAGDASVRLVVRLKNLLREWGIGYFLGEISPENERSATFFTRTLKAVHVGRTERDGFPWNIYAAEA